jgi:M6 family metalloprotease-like protein
MKIRILLFAASFIFICLNIFASDSTFCGVEGYQPLVQKGGLNATPFGTLKVLFIFIDFSDDNIDRDNPTWPVGRYDSEGNFTGGPNYLDDIVDLTETQNSGKYANVTTFFNDMSDEQFKMIGKAYYVQAPQPLSWYQAKHAGAEAAYSAKHAIEALDDTVDFADFDRWIDGGPYTHLPGTDTKLDMVFICFRQWYICTPPYQNYCSSFKAAGWYNASLPGGSVTVDNGNRFIVGSQAVNVLQMVQYPRMEHLLHEFGHVWGLNHQYAPGFWSLMGHRYPTNTSFMNSFEREQLGWIAFHDISTSQTAQLRDFGTHYEAYRMHLGGNEYFILENHQRESIYDNPDATGAKGLYILRQFPNGSYNYEGNLKVETADGRYNWANPSWVPFPSNNIPVPVFERGEINRYFGLTDRDLQLAQDPTTGNFDWHYLITKIDESTGEIVYGSFYRGDGEDAFGLNNNEVFTPWSNPAACLNSGVPSNVGIEILPNSTEILQINYFIGNPINASPSKPHLGWEPRDLGYPFEEGWVYLAWGADLWDGYPIEPDVNWSELHRKIGNGSWTTVYSGPNRQWYSGDSNYDPDGDTPVYFRVRVRDTQNKWSLWSNIFDTRMSVTQSGVGLDKSASKNNSKKIPADYAISPNYPNPFNPETIIKYQIPESGLVQLKIYDLLGRDVATLVNEVKSAGSYSINFDASDLPSGVYIYSLRVNDYVQNQKMTLLK